MAGSRNWITRDEIADIYDARAEKAQIIFKFEGGIGVATATTALHEQAEAVRAIERLSRSLGDRVA